MHQGSDHSFHRTFILHVISKKDLEVPLACLLFLYDYLHLFTILLYVLLTHMVPQLFSSRKRNNAGLVLTVFFCTVMISSLNGKLCSCSLFSSFSALLLCQPYFNYFRFPRATCSKLNQSYFSKMLQAKMQDRFLKFTNSFCVFLDQKSSLNERTLLEVLDSYVKISFFTKKNTIITSYHFIL